VIVFQLKSDPTDKVEVEPDSVTETKIKGTTKPMTVGATLVWVRNPNGDESNRAEVKVVP
jgi:hypothetical protein